MESIPVTVTKLLNAYDIDPINGFLGCPAPLRQIPLDQYPKYKIWEDIMSELPQLLIAQSFAKKMEQYMPVIHDISDLLSAKLRIKQRALTILSFFANAFMNEQQIIVYPKNKTKPKPRNYLPQNIAIPLYKLCKNMNAPPIIRHCNLTLNNWRLLMPPFDYNKRHKLDNMALNDLFLGGIDENWFFLIGTGIESAAGPVITSIVSIQEIMKLFSSHSIDIKQAINYTEKHLKTIIIGIKEMTNLLLRYPEKLDGHIFYKRVRIFLTGCESVKDFPLGVELKGIHKSSQILPGCKKVNNVNTQYLCLRYNGASAAQSAAFPVIDNFLTIDHSSDHFLKLMADYIPYEHKQFMLKMRDERLNMIQCLDILRKYDENESNINKVEIKYNECISKLRAFRTTHMRIAHDMIVIPANKLKEKTKGTGGSTIMPYLQSVRDRTKSKTKQNNNYKQDTLKSLQSSTIFWKVVGIGVLVVISHRIYKYIKFPQI